MSDPRSNEDLIYQYVGADSRYTTAGNHAKSYVRSKAWSSGPSSQLKMVAIALTDVRDFLRFLNDIPKEILKPEQRGCLGLRV